MSRLTREEKIWRVWLLTVAATFAILETHAIKRRKRKATLTYTLRKVLGLSPARPWRILGSAVVYGASGWFAVHIVTGGLVPRALRTLEEVKHPDEVGRAGY